MRPLEPLELPPNPWCLPKLWAFWEEEPLQGTPILKGTLTHQGCNLPSCSSKEAVAVLDPWTGGGGQLVLFMSPVFPGCPLRGGWAFVCLSTLLTLQGSTS